MVYVFFFFYIVIAVIDYTHIYNYLDSKIFYSKNGSKLGRYIKETKSKYSFVHTQKQPIKTFFSKRNVIKAILFSILFLIAQLVNWGIFKDVLFSNFLMIDLIYKKIELVSTFGIYFVVLRHMYLPLYSFFLLIIIFKLNKFEFLEEVLNNIVLLKKEKEGLADELNNKEEIIIGKDVDKNAIKIPINGLYQNLFITGSIGSGKTSSIIANVTDELIGKGYNGLILDVKGNYVKTVEKICEKHGVLKKLFVISDDNNLKYNPLGSDIDPIEMANRLKQVIEIISPNNNSDSYWLDKVENVLYNMIILIKMYNSSKVDFMEIHKLTTNTEYLETKIVESKEKTVKNILDNKIVFEMTNVFLFFEKEFIQMEIRIKNIICSEITRLTIPFITNYEIYKRFGSYDKESEKTKLFENKICVLSINIAKNRVLSKMLSTFIKLEFQKNSISNIANAKTSFLIADEYQEFANSEDANFLALSREAKCINILSMQSYTSLKKSLKNEFAAQVIIQNAVNKIWFRNDDNYTVGEIVKQIGKKYITKENITVSEGAQETKKSFLMKGFKNKKSNISETINYIQNKENIYDENYFTKELKTFEAIVFLSDGMSVQKIQKVKFERWDLLNEK